MTSVDSTSGSSPRILQSAVAVVAWIGASLTGLTAILTACGYVVVHTYLATLGVPRSVYDAKPAEYVVAGGNFLAGLIPLAFASIPALFVYAWWLVVIVVATVAVARWRKWQSATRMYAAALLYYIWISLVLVHLTSGPLPWLLPRSSTTTYGLFVLVLLCTAGLPAAGEPRDMPTRYSSRYRRSLLPLIILIVVSVILLPYLRGMYATVRPRPQLVPLGEDALYLQQLTNCGAECRWSLVDMGETSSILRQEPGGAIYVLPTAKLKTFRLEQPKTP